MSSEFHERLVQEVGAAVRAQQIAVDLVDEAACELMGINRTDARCLDFLDQRGRMTAGDLAEAAHLSTGAVTALIDRMEARGYVRRVRDPADRRRVMVEMTPRAKRWAREIYDPIERAGSAQLAELTDEQLELIRDVVLRGNEILADQLARIRATRRRRIG